MGCNYVLSYFREFEDLSLTTQIDKVEDKLKEEGIGTEKKQTNIGKITSYVGNSAVFIEAPSRGRDRRSFTLIDRGFFDRWFADGKGSISFNGKEGGDDYRVIGYNMVGERQGALHRLILMDSGIDLKGVLVDHKFMNPRINTLEALRSATNRQNRCNTKFYFNSVEEGIPDSVKRLAPTGVSEAEIYAMLTDYGQREHGEFAYNPLIDFTKTWYSYALYKMLGICEWSDLEDYNRDYIVRNEPNTARYYKKLLTV